MEQLWMIMRIILIQTEMILESTPVGEKRGALVREEYSLLNGWR